MKLYFMRHGAYENAGIYYPAADTPLSEEGIQQVRSQLKYLGQQGIERIICSEILRAKQTANIVADELRLSVDTDVRLNERYDRISTRRVLLSGGF